MRRIQEKWSPYSLQMKTVLQCSMATHAMAAYGDVLYHRAFGLNMRSNCHYSYTEPPIKKLASQRLKRVILYI